MKKIKVILSTVLALCIAIACVACDKEPAVTPKPDPVKEYVTVTVVGGTIGTSGVNRDRFEKDAEVTVVANASSDFEQSFNRWEKSGASVSTDVSYKFKASADTTLTAVYGSNYSVWNGEYPENAPATYVEDEEARVVHIKSAEALAYWGSKVTTSKTGTDTTNYKFSAFHFGIYTNQTQGTPTEEQKEAARKAAKQEPWTLSIEANIDLAGFEWLPINDAGFALHDLTIEGNNHIVKNFYTKSFNSGVHFPASMKCGGFFGNVVGSSIAFQNWTFDNAITEIPGDSNNYQNNAILIGYAHGSNVVEYTGKPQTNVFENVTVMNSTIVGNGSLTRKNGILIGRLGVGLENPVEKQEVIIANCLLQNNTIIASDYFGAMIGHIYTVDADITVRNQTKITEYGNVVDGFTVISAYQGNANTPTYLAATLGVWNNAPLFANVQSDVNNPTVKVIDLHVGNGASMGTGADASFSKYAQMCTNFVILKKSLEAGTTTDDVFVPSVPSLFISYDIDIDEDQAASIDWAPNDKQVIYLVAGAKVTGLELGTNVRYIPGTRNASGDLIVTDKAGTEIGAWVITEYKGAYVAKAQA